MSRRTAIRIGAAASVLAVATVTVAAVTTAVIAAVGFAPALRSWLGFSFAGVPSTPRAAIDIAVHNATIAAAPLCAAVAYPRLGTRVRVGISLALVVLLAINAVVIGVALGAYGERALDALLPHALIEIAAFSIAGGAYMQACQQRVSHRVLAAATCISFSMLACASAVEVLTTTSGGRS